MSVERCLLGVSFLRKGKCVLVRDSSLGKAVDEVMERRGRSEEEGGECADDWCG